MPLSCSNPFSKNPTIMDCRVFRNGNPKNPQARRTPTIIEGDSERMMTVLNHGAVMNHTIHAAPIAISGDAKIETFDSATTSGMKGQIHTLRTIARTTVAATKRVQVTTRLHANITNTDCIDFVWSISFRNRRLIANERELRRATPPHTTITKKTL